MDAHDRFTTADLLGLLELPKDGRMLTFGAPSAIFGMEIASARPDTLIVVCDVESQVTTEVADRATAERLDNLIIGDTPAGPLVDRALCVDGLGALNPPHLVTIRSAMLAGGYAIFVESDGPQAQPLIEKLRAIGYQVADELSGALAGSTVIRAR
jgi:hypothetical protein